MPVNLEQIDAGDYAAIRERFDALHEQRYAHHSNVRARRDYQHEAGRARAPREAFARHRFRKGRRIEPKEVRSVYLDQGQKPC